MRINGIQGAPIRRPDQLIALLTNGTTGIHKVPFGTRECNLAA